jgi:hypothetical protein
MIRNNLALLLVSLLVLAARSAAAIELLPGDIVTPQFDNTGTVLVVHPSGDREIFSLAPSIGTGPAMYRPTSIAQLPDGNFLVADTEIHSALTRIDAATGNRTDVARASLGIGPWGTPQDVLLTPTGNAIMVFDGFVAQINLTNGNRTLLSGLGVGSGPDFTFGGAGGSAFAASGHLLVGVYGDQQIYDIDLATGARSIFSGPSRGAGPALSHIMDIVVLSSGQVIAEGRGTGPANNSLFSIDPATGNRTILTTESGFNSEYERITLGAGGQLLGSAPFVSSIFSVDPATGAKTLISGPTRGGGPAISWGDMVLIVPEPATITLLALALPVCWRRRR